MTSRVTAAVRAVLARLRRPRRASEPRVSSWVLHLPRDGWDVAVAPVQGLDGPYTVVLVDPAGREQMRYVGAESVEAAVEHADDFLRAWGLPVGGARAEFARGLDGAP